MYSHVHVPRVPSPTVSISKSIVHLQPERKHRRYGTIASRHPRAECLSIIVSQKYARKYASGAASHSLQHSTSSASSAVARKYREYIRAHFSPSFHLESSLCRTYWEFKSWRTTKKKKTQESKGGSILRFSLNTLLSSCLLLLDLDWITNQSQPLF